MEYHSSEKEVTEILSEVRRGIPGAPDRLFPLVYEELRSIAGRIFAAYRSDDVGVQPTILVHDAFLQLTRNSAVQWESRAHFFAVAATATRQLLVDHVRKKNAAKRGGGWQRVTFAGIEDGQTGDRLIDLMDLEEALQHLGEIAPRQEQIVEMRFFAGLTVEEIAEVLGVTTRTIQYDWRMARAWLRNRLDGGGDRS